MEWRLAANFLTLSRLFRSSSSSWTFASVTVLWISLTDFSPKLIEFSLKFDIQNQKIVKRNFKVILYLKILWKLKVSTVKYHLKTFHAIYNDKCFFGFYILVAKYFVCECCILRRARSEHHLRNENKMSAHSPTFFDEVPSYLFSDTQIYLPVSCRPYSGAFYLFSLLLQDRTLAPPIAKSLPSTL